MRDQKDKRCRYIFTATFDHIYQRCHSFWARLYVFRIVSVVGQR